MWTAQATALKASSDACALIACERCGDCGHVGDAVPKYKFHRPDVRDAWMHYGRSDPRRISGVVGDEAPVVLSSAVRKKCAGDGHCCYHALVGAHGQGDHWRLRAELAEFVAANPGL